jgi:hypothetical protein
MVRLAVPALFCAFLASAQIRVGIVGTDTSHVPAFTNLLNNPAAPGHVPGARVVAAFKGGSRDLPSSWDRVEKYAEEIRAKHGVEIVDSLPALLSKVDAVLLESVDGRAHLPLFREIAKSGKPVFIDKPLASTREDAMEIARLARTHNVKWFSSSTLRFSRGIPELLAEAPRGALVWAPAPLEEHHALDLTWYGIHGVEVLYTLLGPGCVEVTRTAAPDADVVTGRWSDGRIGTIRFGRENQNYGAAVFTEKKALTSRESLYTGYADLVAAIVKFFQTGQTPVPNEVTLEMFAFMEAAQKSKAAGGSPASLQR